MNEIVYELLALLLCGEQQEKRYILDNVKPEYFEYEALSEFFNVVKELFPDYDVPESYTMK